MISDYPPIKQKEWFFGYLLRYNAYSGNIKFRDTIKEWYDDVFALQFQFIPRNQTIEKLTPNYETYISHTVYPYVQVFMNQIFVNKDKENFINGEINWASGILERVSFSSLRNTIKYCPICMKEDFGVFNCENQIREVEICGQHGCFLKNMNIHCGDFKSLGNVYKNIDYYAQYPQINDVYMYIAKQGKYLLDYNSNFNIREIRKAIQNKMLYEDYARKKVAYVLVNDLVEKEYQEYLSSYRTYINKYIPQNMEFNLQHLIHDVSRQHRNISYPIEYLMAIKFLYGDFKNMKDAIIENNIRR